MLIVMAQGVSGLETARVVQPFCAPSRPPRSVPESRRSALGIGGNGGFLDPARPAELRGAHCAFLRSTPAGPAGRKIGHQRTAIQVGGRRGAHPRGEGRSRRGPGRQAPDLAPWGPAASLRESGAVDGSLGTQT